MGYFYIFTQELNSQFEWMNYLWRNIESKYYPRPLLPNDSTRITKQRGSQMWHDTRKFIFKYFVVGGISEENIITKGLITLTLD